MAARFPYFHHALIRTLVGASLAGFGAVALAKEPVVARSASGALSASAAASAPTPVPATATAASSLAAVAKAPPDAPKRVIKLPSSLDPLERVRERLAEKLAAPRAGVAPDPTTLRVATRPLPAGAAAAGELRARQARRHAAAVTHGADGATLAQTSLTADPAHWDYAGGDAGAGPDRWGQLRPEFAKCSTGSRQSPIDIRDGIKVDLDPVAFDYKPSVSGHRHRPHRAGQCRAWQLDRGRRAAL